MQIYVFRPLSPKDLALIEGWRRKSHVVEWWGSPTIERDADRLDDPRVQMWIVEYDGRPFAFAQDYDPHCWKRHHFSYLPSGSRGIDQYIGEVDMLNRGHGTRFVRQLCKALFDRGVPVIGTDPHPRNRRAIAAYQKAGFKLVSGTIETAWGSAILMECWR